MVAAYEIFAPRESREKPRAGHRGEADPRSERSGTLLEIGFLPADHPESRFVEWRELFGRAGLSARETRVLLALARRIQNVGRMAKTSGPRDASPERKESD
jgi:tRNA C32,U32 (ribose-2'-O)-methylase TrmJ